MAKAAARKKQEARARAKVDARERFTPEVRAAFLAAVREGNYLETAAASAGVHPNTPREWLKRGARDTSGPHHEFWKAFRESDAASEKELLTLVRQHAVDDGRLALELMARKYPKRWGATLRLELDAVFDRVLDALERELSDEEFDRVALIIERELGSQDAE